MADAKLKNTKIEVTEKEWQELRMQALREGKSLQKFLGDVLRQYMVNMKEGEEK